MTRDELLALAERVEAYGPDLQECGVREASWSINGAGGRHERVSELLEVGAYESAAMTLVPEGWHTGDFHQGPSGGNWWKLSTIREGATYYTSVSGIGATPALALTAAALRAKAEECEG